METINHYYEEYGDGIPIVFIHPPGMGHVVFKYQRVLANKYRVIMYDLRGHGKTDYNNKELTISLLSRDLLQLLDDCHINKAIICGYSSGGSIAQEFAIHFPERTLGLILCGGFSEVTTFLLRNEFKIGIALAKNNINLLSTILALSHKVTKEDESDIKKYVLLTKKQALIDLYTNGMNYSCTSNLTKILAPVLLIYGDKDYYIHSYERKYREALTNVETVYIDSSFHQIPTRHASPFNHAIDSFIKRTFSL